VSAASGVATDRSPDPGAVLRAAGVARPEMIEAARLRDLSRSHTVTSAELPDGSAYVVKRVSTSARDAGRSLAAEMYAYRLASWHPDLASVLPSAVHLDERRQIVVLVAAPPEQLFPVQGLHPGFPSHALAVALGRALATLHVATTDVPLLTTAACGVVALPDAPAGERRLGSESAAAAAVVDEVLADPVLAAALRRTASALRPACLIHADLKWDNTVLDPGPPARVLLFDWELSGEGDPAWDVGSALADTVAYSARVHGLSSLSDAPAEWLSPALGALLAAYAGRAEGPLPAATVAHCWTARTIHIALECAASVDAAAHPAVRTLLTAARMLGEGHDDVTAAIDGALEGRP
jgi:phosphotransferase family enzyme